MISVDMLVSHCTAVDRRSCGEVDNRCNIPPHQVTGPPLSTGGAKDLQASCAAGSPKRGLEPPNTLSKSVDVRSRQVSAVCDLELRPGPVLCGRSRTAANETRTETGAAPVPKGLQERT